VIGQRSALDQRYRRRQWQTNLPHCFHLEQTFINLHRTKKLLTDFDEDQIVPQLDIVDIFLCIVMRDDLR
jgi:hypothetical protein